MTQNRAIVDKLLTNVSNKYVPLGYLSERILPLITVRQTTGLLGGYGNDHIRIETFLHSGDGPYPRVKVRNRNTQTFTLQKHALSAVIPEEEFDNVEQPFDARKDTADYIMSLLWTEKEKGLADTLGDTSVITQNKTLSGTSQYNDVDNSDPLEDFAEAQTAIEDAVGQKANLAVMSASVGRQLRKHPQILDRLGYKHNRVGMITDQELAQVLDVDEVLIGRVLNNTAKEGQTDVIAPVWGKNIILAVSPKSAAKNQISLGYRIQKGTPRRVNRFNLDDPTGAEQINIDDWYDQLISNAKAAFLIKDAIA